MKINVLGKVEKISPQKPDIWFFSIHKYTRSLMNQTVLCSFIYFYWTERIVLNILCVAWQPKVILLSANCLSNPIAIPLKFRAEVNLWSGCENVHWNSYPVITVPRKQGDFGHYSGSVGEESTQVIIYQDVSKLSPAGWGGEMGSGRTGILNLELRFRVLSSTSRAEAQTMQSYQKDHIVNRRHIGHILETEVIIGFIWQKVISRILWCLLEHSLLL